MNSSSSTDAKSSFESSSKILIISIVTSLVITIVIILLHFYSRYLRRRQLDEIIQRRSGVYNVTTEVESNESSSTPTTPGLDPSTIHSLPSFIYKPTSTEPVDCSVCLGNLVEDNVIKMLPNCKHEFHVECIDKWLESSISCPVCRAMAKPAAKGEGKGKREEESTVGEVNQIERETGSIGSSFRKMFSMGRSSRRIQSVGDIVDEIGSEDLDLERQ